MMSRRHARCAVSVQRRLFASAAPRKSLLRKPRSSITRLQLRGLERCAGDAALERQIVNNLCGVIRIAIQNAIVAATGQSPQNSTSSAHDFAVQLRALGPQDAMSTHMSSVLTQSNTCGPGLVPSNCGPLAGTDALAGRCADRSLTGPPGSVRVEGAILGSFTRLSSDTWPAVT